MAAVVQEDKANGDGDDDRLNVSQISMNTEVGLQY